MQPQTAQDPQELKDLWHWNFTNHMPAPDAIRKIEALRSAAMALADAYIDLAPACRERSLALTNLESSLRDAIAAIARNQPAATNEGEDHGTDASKS